tara:strand:+ start:11789 stop:13060 length:1272 start_codon:yes stop_codon:yes gene_type:complete
MINVKTIHARQILDSRGNPTVECELTLSTGQMGRGISPSGASTGKLEAIELRDNDSNKFNGKSVYKAVRNINTLVRKEVIGKNFNTQEEFDDLLIELDGTNNKKNIGANAILAASLAFCKAKTKFDGIELFESFGDSFSLPVPLMNILNGGAHANNKLDFQEFMIIPVKFPSFSASLQAGCEVFHTLKNQLSRKSLSTAVGDEGGFAPNISSNQLALDIITESIEIAGYIPGEDIYLGLDVASSEFFSNKKYTLNEGIYNSNDFCEYLSELCENYPIISIEDGMAEDDWVGWKQITDTIGRKIQLVGDDVFVTNPEILKKGIDAGIANSILIKLNQIGTVTETINTIDIAKQSDYSFIISHRSGETEDTTIADLSVGTGSNQIKTGSLSRSDRVAKYNRLLRIEENLGENMYNTGNIFKRWQK